MKNNIEVRRPMVAGMFYPSNPVELSKQVAEFFTRAQKRVYSEQIKAIIVPHAGYQYSGQIAANAYKQIEGEKYDAVVIVAPYHGFFKGVSVYSGDGYQTPLGVVKINRAISDLISGKHPGVYASTVGHTGSGGHGEHSLEVQLPFLQMVLGEFELVAMVMGDQEESTIRATAEVLTAVLKEKDALMVASTDMSHFYSEKKARRMDKNFEKALLSFNSNKIIEAVSNGNAEACGFGPVASIIEAQRRIGGKSAEIISYGTSGETTGDFSEVVGYLSAVILGPKREKKLSKLIGMPVKKKIEGYTEDEKQLLLKLAREVVETGTKGKKVLMPEVSSSRLNEKRGVFVTLEKNGMLRGCIGTVQAKQPLAEGVAEMAFAAAFEDPRFPKVTESELPNLEYEISVMSPLSQVDDINDITVGKNGLMIRLDMHSGLLLPQVATENGWDRVAFLEQTCLKAGLSKKSYKDKRARIYKFAIDKF